MTLDPEIASAALRPQGGTDASGHRGSAASGPAARIFRHFERAGNICSAHRNAKLLFIIPAQAAGVKPRFWRSLPLVGKEAGGGKGISSAAGSAFLTGREGCAPEPRLPVFKSGLEIETREAGRPEVFSRRAGGSLKNCLYTPMTAQSSRTAAALFLRAASSEAVSLISMIFSSPAEPSLQGTPMKEPSMPYSPSR